MIEVGKKVRYWDGNGASHEALVTFVHEGEKPAVNLVFVSTDDHATDDYGRQLERRTAVPHESSKHEGASYWSKALDQE